METTKLQITRLGMVAHSAWSVCAKEDSVIVADVAVHDYPTLLTNTQYDSSL